MIQYNIRNIYAQRVTKVLLFIALSKPVQLTFIQISLSKAWHWAGIEGKLDFVVQNNKTDIKPTALQYNGSLNVS